MVRFSALALALLASCGDSPSAEPDGGPVGTPLSCGEEPCTFVISALRPPRMDAEGRVIGVNLDDHVSDESSPQSCGHADFVAPDGTMGVDNQFVELVENMDAAFGEPAEDSFARGINQGDFLFLVSLTDIESTEDPNVAAEAGPATLVDEGEPALDGESLQPDQVFVWTGTPTMGEGSIADGRLEVPIGDVAPVLVIDDTTSDWLPISDARLLVPFGTGEPRTGILVGRMEIDEIIASLPSSPLGPSLIRNTLEGVADLDPDSDGVCQAISVAFEVELVRARIEP